MLSPEVLLTFFAASLLLGIAPGPDNIFVLTQSAVYGVRAGLVTTLGLVTGLCVHTTAVALGVAAIFQTSPLAFTILKCAGAAYLLYLAWMSFRAGALLAHTPGGGPPFRLCRPVSARHRDECDQSQGDPLFPGFSAPVLQSGTGRGGRAVLTLGTLFMLATVLVFIFSVAVLGGRLALWFNRSQRGQILVHRAAGLVFAGLAVVLLFTGP